MSLVDRIPDFANRFATVGALEGAAEVLLIEPIDRPGVRMVAKAAPSGGELSALLSLRGHPGIPELFEVGADYVIREFVPGRTLAELVRDEGPLDAESARRVARGLLEALAAVHLLGVLHLDIKPANVVLRDGDFDGAQLLDFGMSGRHVTAAGGTPFFAAPEQGRGLPCGPRTDLFGVGATLLACLHPDLDVAGVLRDYPRREFLAAAGVESLPAPFDRLLPQLLEPHAERRPADAQDAMELLTGRGSGRPRLASLAPDPIAIYSEWIERGAGTQTVTVRGSDERSRSAVALAILHARGAGALEPAAEWVRVEGDEPAVTLELPSLDRDGLAAHLARVLHLDVGAAVAAAGFLLADRAALTPKETLTCLDRLVGAGAIVPQDTAWDWPAARAGRLAADQAEDALDEPTIEAAERLCSVGRVESAVTCFARLPESEARLARHRFAECLLAVGEPSRALSYCTDDPVLQARARLDLGDLATAERLLQTTPATGAERVRVRVAFVRNDADALRSSESIWSAAATLEDRVLEGLVKARLGRSVEAETLLRSLLESGELAGRPFLEGVVSTCLGDLARGAGRLDEAVDHHERSLAAYRTVGHARHAATASLNLGVLAKDRGAFRDARDRLRTARSTFEAIGDRRTAAIADANLGIVELEEGRASPAIERFDSARGELDRLGGHDLNDLLAALSARAFAMLARADLARAQLSGISDRPSPRVQTEVARTEEMLAELESSMSQPNGSENAHGGVVPTSVFRSLLAVNRRLASESDLRRAMEYLLETAETLTGARGSYLLVERDDAVSIEVTTSARASRAFSRSLANKAINEQRVLTAADALADRGLMEMPSVQRLNVRSALCAPFEALCGVRGAIYVEHPGRPDAFGVEETEYLEVLADQGAIAVDRMIREEQLQERLRHTERNLAVAERSASRRRSSMLGKSAPMRELRRQIERVATTDLSVLIVGETGSGKELVARAIHEHSPFRSGPFVSENCSAIPAELIESELFGHVRGAFTGADADKPGLMQLAHGGTLFLDEVGDMPLEMQAKLLRALQERSVRPVGGSESVAVDFRLVTATHKDLRAMASRSEFREDLFYRVAAGELRVPPLRDRGDDVLLLAQAFLDRLNRDHRREVRLEAAAQTALAGYAWPGNVRELEHVVMRSFLLTDGEELLVSGLGGAREVKSANDEWGVMTIDQAIDRTIDAAMESTGGDKTAAARLIGMSRSALYQRLRRRESGEE